MLTGKLEKGAVLKAICSGFEETTEPAVCLTDGSALGLHYLVAKFTHQLIVICVLIAMIRVL